MAFFLVSLGYVIATIQHANLPSLHHSNNESINRHIAQPASVKSNPVQPWITLPNKLDLAEPSTHEAKRDDETYRMLLSEADDAETIFDTIEGLKSKGDRAELVRHADKLKRLVQSDPQALLTVSHLLNTAEPESTQFHFALAALQALSAKQADDTVLALASQFSASVDADSQQKFLQLLRNVNAPERQAEFTQSLIDLGSGQHAELATKLAAWELLQPSQLHNSEQQQVLAQISLQVTTANKQELDFLVSQALRFTNQQQASQLTNEWLQQQGEQKLRLLAVESVLSGDVSIDQSLLASLRTLSNDDLNMLDEDQVIQLVSMTSR